METAKIFEIIAQYANRLPAVGLDALKAKLTTIDDESKVQQAFSQLKNPTTALVLSLCCGGLSIDRFYIGDTGKAVAKLLTCGGVGIWTIIDWFKISKRTRSKNLDTLLANL